MPPNEATQPSETLPLSSDTLGPQGPYDTHDWWAEQEEAAREEAQRQADAQHAVPPSPGAAPASQPSAFEPATAEVSAPEAGELPDGAAADQASAAPTRTDTVPNPAITPPREPGTPPSAGQPSTAPSKPPTPHDDALAIAEEQAW